MATSKQADWIPKSPNPTISPIQHPKDYFNNNGQGYPAHQVIKPPKYNIQVELYCNHLKPGKLETIQQDIQATADDFFEALKLPPSSTAIPEIFRIYLFDNKEDYQYFGGPLRFNWDLGDEGGKAYYRGQSEVHSELYVYQEGNTRNLKHEFTHALTFYATGGNHHSMPQWLIEGISEYFEHQKGVVYVSQQEIQALNTEALSRLGYSEDPDQNSLLYRMGHAVVSYLQEQYPRHLSQYVTQQNNQQFQQAERLLQQALEDLTPLQQWLNENSLEKLLQDSNVLKVIPEDDSTGTRKSLVGNQVKQLIYHPAVITTQKGDKVGRFSPIHHLWFVNTIRSTNQATNDYLDIPKDYGFLKVLKTAQEGLTLEYCDKNGSLYGDTPHYQESVSNKVIQLVPALLSAIQPLEQEKERATDDFNQASQKTLNAYQTYTKAEKSGKTDEIPHLYQQYEMNLETMEKFRNVLLQAQQNIKQFKNNQRGQNEGIENRFKALLQIAPHQLTEIEAQDIQDWQVNQVFRLEYLGRADLSALSLFNESSQVCELSTEVGFFQSIDNSEDTLAKESPKEFFYGDILKKFQTRYQAPHLAVTQTKEGYHLAFIEDKSIQGDQYFTEPHFHQNELLTPGLQHIDATDLQPLLFKGFILNHAESSKACYSKEQRQKGIIVETGDFLDDKGTQRTDDDNYAAVVKKGEQLLHHFTNTGFYITEAIKNSQDQIIEPSSFFIHDHGRNVRWQLPGVITHLKLVTTAAGRKLVPCDANGNDSPEGMPDIPDEYRLIDPLFAHQYAKQDHSHQHINIGLINFDKYEDETLFSIQYDPNDPSIRRDTQGNIVRENPGRIYITQVKLGQDGQEIGMLSNSFHHFTGEIFFSADLNYSYTDFLASVSPQVVVETTDDGGKKISFNRGPGDLGGTDRGYTDHMLIPVRSLATNMASLQEQQDVNHRAQEQQVLLTASSVNSSLFQNHD